MPKVVYFTSQSEEEAQFLIQCAPQDFEVGVHSSGLSGEEKAQLVPDADFLLLFPGNISESVLKAARNVKLIQLVSAGYEGMDLAFCAQLGIPVANNGGSNAVDVAEHTLAMILGFYRRLTDLDNMTRTSRWHEHKTGLTTYTINGKTVGIVGFGHIGRQVARILRAFGAYLIYTDVQTAPAEFERELRISHVSLIELLQASDIVSLHVPIVFQIKIWTLGPWIVGQASSLSAQARCLCHLLIPILFLIIYITPETRGLIGRRELAHMKPTGLLVNTCRGGVVDEAALIDVLREGRILGAALDVLDREPPDRDNPLLSMENVLLTPHIAGVTYDTWRRRGAFVFQNMQRVWDGHPPTSVVQISDGE